MKQLYSLICFLFAICLSGQINKYNYNPEKDFEYKAKAFYKYNYMEPEYKEPIGVNITISYNAVFKKFKIRYTNSEGQKDSLSIANSSSYSKEEGKNKNLWGSWLDAIKEKGTWTLLVYGPEPKGHYLFTEVKVGRE